MSLVVELDAVFQGAHVPRWLEAFAREPDVGMAKLLFGTADMGGLGAADPGTLMLHWLHGIGGTCPEFVGAVDEAMARWVEAGWGRTDVAEARGSAAVLAAGWCTLGTILGARTDLRRTAAALAAHVRADREFLAGISQGRSRDPLASAWWGLARYQPDRALLVDWRGLCSLQPGVPWYHGALGLRGLRHAPPADATLRGGFSYEVADGLVRFARGLIHHEAERWLPKRRAEEEFTTQARVLLRAFPYPDAWRQFWQDAVGRHDHDPPSEWIEGVFGPAPRQGGKRRPPPVACRWNPGWPDRARRIATDLRQHNPQAVVQAEKLLREQRVYADATGNTSGVVRSACNFSGAIRSWRPELALEWAGMARELDPWDTHAVNNHAAAFLRLGRLSEAARASAAAVRRFPDDVVARTGLAEVLKAQARHPEAESVYRETVAQFPDDVVARTGLAEVLKAQARHPEAESVYRETVAQFPDNVVARNGLAEVLKAQARHPEAESVYRETVARFPDDVVARNGLAEVLKAQARHPEAESVYRETVARLPDDVVARNGLAHLCELTDRFDEAGTLYQKTLRLAPGDPYATGGLERVAARRAGTWLPSEAPSEQAAPRIHHPAPLQVSGHAPAQVRSAAAAPASDTDLRREDTEVILADAYLLRRWCCRQDALTPATTMGDLQARAKGLLDQLLPQVGTNVGATAEAGLLYLATDELDQAMVLLQEAQRRFPGSARIQYAWFAAQRARLRARSGDLPLSQVCQPLKRLARLGDQWTPLANLAEGRFRLESDVTDAQAEECFGKTAYWVHQRLPRDLEALPDTSDPAALRQSIVLPERASFDQWWARETQVVLFGSHLATKQDDLPDLGLLRDRLMANRVPLDVLEQEYADRLAS